MAQDYTNSTLKRNYFTFKTNKASIDILAPTGTELFEFGEIYLHHERTKPGDIVFFVQHGDNPPWEQGLSAICQVVKGPFDRGYKKRNFKVILKQLLKLPQVLSRHDLIGFFNCYNITFIGPMTKGEPNQANKLMTIEEVENLTGVLISKFPEIESSINSIFGKGFSIRQTEAKIQNPLPNMVSEENIPSDEYLPVSKYPHNLIIYGAPGTGKSFELNRRVRASFGNNELFTRITFHSNYTYKNFIGSYLPKPVYRKTDGNLYLADRRTKITDDLEPLIDYSFEPGPLMIMLCKAIKNPNRNYVIVIEEINRANTASVFGDFFQLLDRDEKGISEYSITLDKPASNYLDSQEIASDHIRIPSNLYIWASMNNADQGVLPLDTAFKRRWNFEHLSLNEYQEERKECNIFLPHFINDELLSWNSFRKTINDSLINLGLHEDKLIGPFFLSSSEIRNPFSVKNKLLLYLKEDVLRYKAGLFRSDLKTFSMIAEAFDNQENVFDESLLFEVK